MENGGRPKKRERDRRRMLEELRGGLRPAVANQCFCFDIKNLPADQKHEKKNCQLT